jgi:hypothetical protein
MLPFSQWKRFFQLISGVHYDAPEEVVEEKLLAASKELQDGILGYKKSDPKSMEKLEKEMKNAGQEKIISFAQKLYQFLVGEISFFFTYGLVNWIIFRTWMQCRAGIY